MTIGRPIVNNPSGGLTIGGPIVNNRTEKSTMQAYIVDNPTGESTMLSEKGVGQIKLRLIFFHFF